MSTSSRASLTTPRRRSIARACDRPRRWCSSRATSSPIKDPEFRAAVADVDAPPAAGSVRRERQVAARRRRLRLGGRPCRARRLRDRRRLDRSEGSRRCRSLRRWRASQADHPALDIEQFGSASANKAVNETISDDLKKRRSALDPDHADHPHHHLRLPGRGGCAAADRDHVRDGRARPRRAPERDPPGGRQPAGGDPADRPGRRRRLLALLPEREREERAARAQRDRRAGGGRSHLRAGRPDLRRHGDRRDGRHAHQRRQGVHLVRRGDDPRRRDRDVRVADRAARDAQLARRPRREGPRSVPRPPAQAGGSVPLLVVADRPGDASPGHLAGARGRAAGGAGDSGARDEERDQRHRRAAAGPPGDRDLQQGQGRVPGRGRDHDGRGRGRRRARRRRWPPASTACVAEVNGSDAFRPGTEVTYSEDGTVAKIDVPSPGSGTDPARRRPWTRCATRSSRRRSAGSTAPR